jgi:hypothetical protein
LLHCNSAKAGFSAKSVFRIVPLGKNHEGIGEREKRNERA